MKRVFTLFLSLKFEPPTSCNTSWTSITRTHTSPVSFGLPTCYNRTAVISTQSQPSELFQLVVLGIPLHHESCLLPRSFTFLPGDGDTVLTQSFERNLKRVICWARVHEWERVNHTQMCTYFPEWLKNNLFFDGVKEGEGVSFEPLPWHVDTLAGGDAPLEF